MNFLRIPLLMAIFLIGSGCSNQNDITNQSKDLPVKQSNNLRQTDNVQPINQTNTNITNPNTLEAPKSPVPKKQAAQPVKKEKVILNVPLVKQNPELKYGCEVTSLTMVLQYAGVKVNKMKLAKQLERDMDPVVKDKNGNIIKWGNPDDGFVGDITGKHMGYAVFDKPMERLMSRYLPNRTVNLTNKPFEQILAQVAAGKPVLVWTTGDYRLPDRWESWRHGNQVIKTPLDLHAVVLVGYDRNHVYLNDPLSGRKNVQVNKSTFIGSWTALKKRALSYK